MPKQAAMVQVRRTQMSQQGGSANSDRRGKQQTLFIWEILK
jgi:hypothetical protein